MRKQFVFVPRDKNLAALAETGLLHSDIKHIIADLTAEEYCAGPETDRDNAGFALWIFGVPVNGTEHYLKLSDDFSGGCAKCVSFHRAEQPLRYPWRRKRT